MKECDHIVMMINQNTHSEFTRESEVQIQIQIACSDANRMADFGGISCKKKFMPDFWLDRRRGYSILFNFCPDCGAKIDWKRIKSNLK